MLNRFKNSAIYGYKGLIRFAPFGSIPAGVMIGTYWLVKYMSYSSAINDGLKIRKSSGCLQSDPECLSHYGSIREWHKALDEISKNFGIEHANADLNEIWPAFVLPCMAAGLVAGAIYGFVKTPDEEFSDEENLDYPEEFKDPILYYVMRDPYALNCGGNHNLDYNTLQQLEPNAHSKLCCPLCRGEILNPYPNTQLKHKIENYDPHKKNTGVTSIEINKETIITTVNDSSDIINAESFEKGLDEQLNSAEFENLELYNPVDKNDTETNSAARNQSNKLTAYKQLFNFSFFALKQTKPPQDCEKTIADNARLSIHNKH